jgi:hypothetical protein
MDKELGIILLGIGLIGVLVGLLVYILYPLF